MVKRLVIFAALFAMLGLRSVMAAGLCALPAASSPHEMERAMAVAQQTEQAAASHDCCDPGQAGDGSCESACGSPASVGGAAMAAIAAPSHAIALRPVGIAPYRSHIAAAQPAPPDIPLYVLHRQLRI
jgi:hypothetical protein